MRVLSILALSCLLAGGAMAQRGGARGGGGGMGGARGGMGGMGGGFRGGMGGFRGGAGGFHGGVGGFHGGFHNGFGGFHNGFGRFGFGHGFRNFNNNFFGFGFGFSPFIGWGGGYWPYLYDTWGWSYPYYGYGYGYPYSGYGYGGGYGGYPYNYGYAGNAGYNTSPNVTVVYPPMTTASTGSTERANPVTREYDQYGQEVKPSTQGTAPSTKENQRPIYLIAFKNQTIRAAVAYWVTGQTLHYVTTANQTMQAPLDTVDRSLTMQLNRERNVPFQLPQ